MSTFDINDTTASRDDNQSHSIVPSAALCIDSLEFSYQKNTAAVITIPSWQVAKGDSIFIQGQSGSGKSTLLNLLAGTITPTAGTITLLGVPVSSLSAGKRDRFRAKHIGVVFQQLNLIPYLTIADNIAAAMYFAGNNTATLADKLTPILSALQLPQDCLHLKADSLSVGQQQRVAIARAMINQPEIIIVDEPTSALDASARDSFMELLMTVTSDSTLLFVSHDAELKKYFSTTISMAELQQSGHQ